jgi:hypothetical protein
MVSFPQASPPTPCAHLSLPPYAPHALPISFVSILPPAASFGYFLNFLSVSVENTENWNWINKKLITPLFKEL